MDEWVNAYNETLILTRVMHALDAVERYNRHTQGWLGATPETREGHLLRAACCVLCARVREYERELLDAFHERMGLADLGDVCLRLAAAATATTATNATNTTTTGGGSCPAAAWTSDSAAASAPEGSHIHPHASQARRAHTCRLDSPAPTQQHKQ
jgi:hypothetical protein